MRGHGWDARGADGLFRTQWGGEGVCDAGAQEIVGEMAEAWDTPRSGTNFMVVLEQDGQRRVVGMVHRAVDGVVRILA